MIRSSFKLCGIFPFDPSIVLDPLKRKLSLDNENPLEMWFGEGNGPTGSPKYTTPSSITSSPKTLQRFQKDIKKVQRGLDGTGEALDSLPILKGRLIELSVVDSFKQRLIPTVRKRLIGF